MIVCQHEQNQLRIVSYRIVSHGRHDIDIATLSNSRYTSTNVIDGSTLTNNADPNSQPLTIVTNSNTSKDHTLLPIHLPPSCSKAINGYDIEYRPLVKPILVADTLCMYTGPKF